MNRLDQNDARLQLSRMIGLQKVGRDLAFAGFRHGRPERTEEEFREYWRKMLEQRRSRKWGGYVGD